jgi:hypothetical protein
MHHTKPTHAWGKPVANVLAAMSSHRGDAGRYFGSYMPGLWSPPWRLEEDCAGLCWLVCVLVLHPGSCRWLTDGWGGQACMPSGCMLHRTVIHAHNLPTSPDTISDCAGGCEGGVMGQGGKPSLGWGSRWCRWCCWAPPGFHLPGWHRQLPAPPL